MPRIAFAWVGCKLNRYEIQSMSERLAPYGFQTVPFGQPADCYVVNTCTVTSDADLSSRQLIRRARRKSPNAKVVVTGCYAQLRPEEIKELEVDRILSNRDKEKLPETVLDLFGISGLPSLSEVETDSVISHMSGMTRAFVKIQDGCDDQCAFCAIWEARGPVKSRPIEAIIREINKLSENGFKEAALTGVHIGKYYADGHDLAGLLVRLAGETSIKRIRLSSLNPIEITEKFVNLMASNDKLCPHVHLSAQSGDDDILREMGRQYGRKRIADAVDMLVGAVPSITIGADFIVGFPGEHEDNFENTFRLVNDHPFHHLHIFPYSDRPGTRAALVSGKVSNAAKEIRAKRLRALVHEKKQKHLSGFIGKPLHVLVENRLMKAGGYLTGLSENYLRINIYGPEDLKGNIARVVPDSIVDGKLTAIFKKEPAPIKRS
jgi:threonylcarbamoyladenosine tRNA methylthiotransferase MtaB